MKIPRAQNQLLNSKENIFSYFKDKIEIT
uniref:Uncharacterized protein n=1 Tax=Rhizophora mucronata TaxID=61149 RepID=A0A2P2NEY9_RHIMU